MWLIRGARPSNSPAEKGVRGIYPPVN